MGVLKYYDTSTSTWLPAIAGIQGATGPSGGTYIHVQTSSSTVWTVNHNLGERYVNVEPIDSTDRSFVGRYDYPTIDFLNDSSLTLTFLSPQSGYVAVSYGGMGATGPSLNYQTTSSSGLSIIIPSTVNAVVGTGLPYTPNQNIIFSAVGQTNKYMTGSVVSYDISTGDIEVNVTGGQGSGAYADWDVNIFTPQGATGETGATGSTGPAGPPGGTYIYTQSTPSSVWTITHNLGARFVNVEPADSAGQSYVGRYDYPTINFIDDTTLTLTFSSAVTGFAAISAAGPQGATGLAGPPGGAYIHTQSVANTTWVINHNLDCTYVNIEPVAANGYSYAGRYDYPTIYFNNANAATVTFSSAVTGYAAVSAGGQIGATGETGPTGPTGPAGSVGGSNTQIQFNDNSVFNGSANLIFDKSTNVLTVIGNISGSNLNASGYVIRSTQTGISAAGTEQANATILTKEFNEVSTVNSGQGIKLPASVAGMAIVITNTSANSLLVYPATSGVINSQVVNAAYTQIAGSTIQYIAMSTTQWYTVGGTYS